MDVKEQIQGLIKFSSAKKANPLVIWLLGAFGAFLVLSSLWLVYQDWNGSRVEANARLEGQQSVDMVGEQIRRLNQVLTEEAITSLAARIAQGEAEPDELTEALKQKEPAVLAARVWSTEEISDLQPMQMGPNGFAVFDMLLSVMSGQPSMLQIHRSAEPQALFNAVLLGSGESPVGVMLVSLDVSYLTDTFKPEWSNIGFIRLAQYNGRQPTAKLAEFGDPGRLGEIPDRIPVAGSLFRVEFPQVLVVSRISGLYLLLVLIAGVVCLLAFFLLRKHNHIWLLEHQAQEAARQRAQVKIIRKVPGEDQASNAQQVAHDTDAEFAESREASTDTSIDKAESGNGEDLLASEPPRMRLHYDIAERRLERETEHDPVELKEEIFRAYDIRGVIDKTLDSGVARMVGQAVGTLALRAEATPVVVARDGRLSGPYLMEGMIQGIIASGCDVLDIGAMPTGVLYYAAHEKASGSGVMITGSHNPPDYNGFKIMIKGDPLSGEAITGIFRMIQSGDLQVGKGSVETANVVQDYIDRIASDIQMEKPLKVVMDCGNGIGGVCATQVLEAIGAEVLPLFDEVDGTFPNHHPDPGDPENLEDLIASVRLMDADLGLALDGDADRLGVVTLAGDIIYPDRVMMLLALDVLDRNPGATIIYDVKCTQHLPRVIEEAGGKAVMYKTGHSLIKARMKEIGSPFAGEMSGHFFFGERWYGVDDGIYAAARLLEILGGTETPPEAILSALPSSYSTPELKVQMQEGENHAFVEAFRKAAKFEGAEVHSIDGVRADFKDGWGLVRASNTTPILVVRFDADTEEALDRIKNTFRVQMLALRSDLELPF